MFKQDNEAQEGAVDTIVGQSVSVEGNFKGEGNIIFEGEIKGNLKTKGFLKAVESSVVVANINVGSAEIAGQLTGNIKIKDHLEIRGSAVVQGDIETNTLTVEHGAVLNGNIKMRGEGKIIEENEESDEAVEDAKLNKKKK